LKLQARVNEVYLTLRDAQGDDVPVMVNIWRRPRDERFVSDWALIAMHQRDGYEDQILAARDEAEASARESRSRLDAIAEALRTLEKSKDPEEIARAIAAITSQVA
jgi:phosphoserine phosphatase RsbU/P